MTGRITGVTELGDAAGAAFLSPARWHSAPHDRLADHGYEVRELLVEGIARIYAEGTVRPPAVSGEARFVTRVLVVAPADTADFSGTAHVELLNPSTGIDFPMYWPDLAAHMMRRGDAYVGVTCKAVTASALATHRPDRYAALHVEHDGAVFDLLGLVATALRSTGPHRLLGRLDPARTIVATGWSQSGSMLRTYLSEGLHQQHLDEAGSPVIDAFLIGVSSGGFGPMGYVNVDRDGETEWDDDLRPITSVVQLPIDDPRRVVRGSRVPVLELMTEDEAHHHVWHQRPDSDAPGDLYRCYQLPARGHESGLLDDSVRVDDHREIPGLETPPGSMMRHTASTFLLAAAVDHLVGWAHGAPAPRADPIAVVVDPGAHLDPEGFDYRTSALTDRHGHAVGGVRYLEVEVPVATVGVDADGPTTARQWQREPWPPARLAATYGTPAELRRLASVRCAELVDAGAYLAEDAVTAVDELCRAAGDF